MARHKKNHGAHENHERWLLTYADMITLLVAFFIMLYAMSVMNITKFQVLALSVRSGFGGMQPNSPSILVGQGDNSKSVSITPSPSPSSSTTTPQAQIMPNLRQEAMQGDTSQQSSAKKPSSDDVALDNALAALKSTIKDKHLSDVLQVHESEERGIVITVLTDKFLFDKGQANLRPQFLWVLDLIAEQIRKLPNDVRVEGHTDNLPIHTALFPSNWELSTARATNVLRYFLEHGGIGADRLSAAGYADTRPVRPNDNDADRARNRRVDIVILRSSTDNEN